LQGAQYITCGRAKSHATNFLEIFELHFEFSITLQPLLPCKHAAMDTCHTISSHWSHVETKFFHANFCLSKTTYQSFSSRKL